MMQGQLHHVGYACKNISEALEWVLASGVRVIHISKEIFDPLQGVSLCFIKLDGAPNIELVAGEPVKNFLTHKVATEYHICYEVEDLDLEIAEYLTQGAVLISEKKPAVLFGNRQVVFLQTQQGIVELLEGGKDAHAQELNMSVLANCIIEPVETELKQLNQVMPGCAFKLRSSQYNLLIDLKNKDSIFYDQSSVLRAVIVDLRHLRPSKLQNFLTQTISLLCESLDVSKLPVYVFFITAKRSIDIQCLKTTGLKDLAMYAHFNYEIIANDGSMREELLLEGQCYKTIAMRLARIAHYCKRKPFKVIVVDCDNTLWVGNCAEQKVELLDFRSSHLELQKKLQFLSNRGVLICLCSNNNESDVINAFSNSKMVLQLNDITLLEINWDNKAEKIKRLSEKLNLSVDKFVFIDDSQFECELVGRAFPDLFVLQFPVINEQALRGVRYCWALDAFFSDSRAFVDRKQYYRNEEKRREIHSKEGRYFSDYVQSLHLVLKCKLLGVRELTRSYEMVQRVTQFTTNPAYNLDFSDVESLQKKGKIYAAYLEDVFEDYGLIGLVVLDIKKSKMLIQQVLLSCRALGRGVELLLLNWLIQLAVSRHVEMVEFSFVHSARNTPAINFFSRLVELGIARKSDQLIQIKVDEYNELCPSTFEVVHDVSVAPERFSLINFSQSLINQQIKMALQFTLNQGKMTYQSINLLVEAMVGHKVFNETSDLFAENGLTSLAALELILELKRSFLLDLTYGQLLKNPSIQGIKENALTLSHRPEVNVIKAVGRNKEFYPLSLNQLPIIYDDKLTKVAYKYNVPITLYFEGGVLVDKLRTSVGLVLASFDVLHSAILNMCGQYVFSGEAAGFFDSDFFSYKSVVDLDKKQISAKLNTFIVKPFDLRVPPLLRFLLLKVSQDEFILSIVAHHAIIDGHSFNLLLQKLSDAYNDTMSISKAAEEEVDFFDYALWYNQKYKRQQGDLKQYWCDKLQGATFPDFMPGRKSSNAIAQARRGMFYALEFSPADSTALVQLTSEQQSNLVAFFMSIYAIVIRFISGASNMVIGSSILGRDSHQCLDLIGYLSHFVPIRCDISEALSFRAFLAETTQNIVEAGKYHSLTTVDFLRLFSELKLNMDNLFSASFTFQESVDTYVSFHGMKLKEYSRAINISRFQLSLELELTKGKVKGGVYYNDAIFSLDDIKKAINMLHKLVAVLKKGVDVPLADLLSSLAYANEA